MKLREMKFVPDEFGDYWYSAVSEYAMLCNSGIVRYFNIPEDVSAIWLSLHDENSPNRYKLVRNEDWGGCGVCFEIEGEHPGYDGWFDELIERVSKKHNVKTLYLELQYLASEESTLEQRIDKMTDESIPVILRIPGLGSVKGCIVKHDYPDDDGTRYWDIRNMLFFGNFSINQVDRVSLRNNTIWLKENNE